ncbi:MAG: hypothetical protein KAT20_00170, partial [Desulfuromonadales bacterium]|nr:hypothetical protein [Desulfuromonadales bacterium]
MRFNLSFLLLIFLLLLPTGQPLAAGDSYSAIRSDYHRLIKSSQLQRQRVNWEKIIRRLDRFAQRHSAGPDIEKALFLKARVWDGLSRVSGGGEDAREAISQYLEMV